jgi:hypothetical protein
MSYISISMKIPKHKPPNRGPFLILCLERHSLSSRLPDETSTRLIKTLLDTNSRIKSDRLIKTQKNTSVRQVDGTTVE